MIKSIYISGPITGMKNLNREAFIKAHKFLTDKTKCTVLNPIEITEYLPKNSTHEDYMIACIKVIINCDAIYMLHGWWHSRGAIVELIVAKACGLKIIWEKYK